MHLGEPDQLRNILCRGGAKGTYRCPCKETNLKDYLMLAASLLFSLLYQICTKVQFDCLMKAWLLKFVVCLFNSAINMDIKLKLNIPFLNILVLTLSSFLTFFSFSHFFFMLFMFTFFITRFTWPTGFIWIYSKAVQSEVVN